MSVQTALQFIQKIRQDESLRRRVQALGRAADLESVVTLGEAAGYSFTVADLQTAFKHDWAMRWIHYGASAKQAEE